MTKKIIAFFTTIAICAAMIHPISLHAENTETGQLSNTVNKAQSYFDYHSLHTDAPPVQQQILLTYGEMTASEEAGKEMIDGKEAIVTGETGFVEFTFPVQQAGNYHMVVEYYPVEGKTASIERELSVDGVPPFEEAKRLVFKRTWKDAEPYRNGFVKDPQGNDIRPSQIEAPVWQSVIVRDTTGYYNDPYTFYLSEGKHTVRLTSLREPMAIAAITLKYVEAPPSYSQLKEEYKSKGYREVEGEQILMKEAEDAYLKSDPTLYPIFDRTSAATSPFDPVRILLNSIGSSKWRYPGEWISWKITVPKSGLYRIGLRARQNLVSGQFVTRRLYLDGSIPFQEADHIRFHYKNTWQVMVLGDEEEEYLFYLEEGEHVLTLEATLGSFSDILREVEDSVYTLNQIYRQILMITGPNPDPFRDYELDMELPETMELLKQELARLRKVIGSIRDITGSAGGYVSSLERLCVRMEDMIKNPERIPSRFQDFKEGVVSLGAWILTSKEQPLELDYIMLLPKNSTVPKAEAGIFQGLITNIKMFIASFFMDYNTLGGTDRGKEAIDVWITQGRDQANILRQLIDHDFTRKTGIQANLRLVAPGSLLPAILSGNGPDVNLGSAMNEPINFAMKKAVLPLNDFDGFDEVVKDFHESSLVPYFYEGSIYALPETQTFPVMFYRMDILSELGIDIPDTWDDVTSIIPELQKKHMEFGLPSLSSTIANGLDVTSYWTFLFQSGGKIYSDDSKKVVLDSREGVTAFKKWTNYYTGYRLPVTYDFPTRFRMGEIPIGIADYTMYNLLSVFAPEINGLWGFTTVPGTKREDGTIDRSVAGSGVASEIIATTKKPEEAWQFLKWWVSADTQSKYGQELESIMGASARYPSANRTAIESMPWSVKDLQVIHEQWKHLKGVPEIPGGYLKDREINFVFREVVLKGMDPREALIDRIDTINMEIDKKRKEFGLD